MTGSPRAINVWQAKGENILFNLTNYCSSITKKATA